MCVVNMVFFSSHQALVLGNLQTFFDHGEYKYWTMGDPVGEEGCKSRRHATIGDEGLLV